MSSAGRDEIKGCYWLSDVCLGPSFPDELVFLLSFLKKTAGPGRRGRVTVCSITARLSMVVEVLVSLSVCIVQKKNSYRRREVKMYIKSVK